MRCHSRLSGIFLGVLRIISGLTDKKKDAGQASMTLYESFSENHGIAVNKSDEGQR